MLHLRPGFLSTTGLAHNGNELTLASYLATRAWFILGLWHGNLPNLGKGNRGTCDPVIMVTLVASHLSSGMVTVVTQYSIRSLLWRAATILDQVEKIET